MSKSKITKSLLIGATLILTACGGGGSSSATSSNSNSSNFNSNSEVNEAPTVNAGDDRKAQIDVPVLIWGSASDIDGTISSYEWKKGEEVLGTTAKLTYIPTKLGIDKLTLTAVDDDGVSASDSINIEVVTEAVEDTYNRDLPNF
jgi:hypothetical protein